MSDLEQISRLRKDRGEKMAVLFGRRAQMTPRARLVLLNDVLNSLIDEHNAITEPEGRYGGNTVVRADLATLQAFDAWYDGGDIMDLLRRVNACVPYDPTLVCSCLPRRP